MVCIVKLLKSWDLLFELPEKKCLVVLFNVRYPVLVFNHQIVAARSKGLCLVIVPGLVYANAESTMWVWGATDVEQATTAIYPQCVNCSCDAFGSQHLFCDPRTGQCLCKGSFRGQNCNLCRSGYYGFPNCRACECNPAGIKPLPGRPLGDCSSSNTVSLYHCLILIFSEMEYILWSLL